MPPAYPIIQQSTDHDSTDYDFSPFIVGLQPPNGPSTDIEQGATATAGLPSKSLLHSRACWRRHVLILILLQFKLTCYFLFILLYQQQSKLWDNTRSIASTDQFMSRILPVFMSYYWEKHYCAVHTSQQTLRSFFVLPRKLVFLRFAASEWWSFLILLCNKLLGTTRNSDLPCRNFTRHKNSRWCCPLSIFTG